MKFLKSSLLLSLCLSSSIALAEVVVIVNPSNTSHISSEDIKRIFLGKNKAFANGDSVNAVNLKSGNATRTDFERQALGKSGAQVKAYWSKLIFSGKAKPLKEITKEEDVLSLVSTTPNAIGYIDSSKVDASVKVVKKL